MRFSAAALKSLFAAHVDLPRVLAVALAKSESNLRRARAEVERNRDGYARVTVAT